MKMKWFIVQFSRVFTIAALLLSTATAFLPNIVHADTNSDATSYCSSIGYDTSTPTEKTADDSCIGGYVSATNGGQSESHACHGANSSDCKAGWNGVDPALNCTSNNCNLVQEYVVPTINLLSAAFGLIAVISLLLGAINYITSEGDPQKVSRAKVRIRNTIFAVVAFMFLYAFLNFLIPGGIFQ
jgi:hypothetical protein